MRCSALEPGRARSGSSAPSGSMIGLESDPNISWTELQGCSKKYGIDSDAELLWMRDIKSNVQPSHSHYISIGGVIHWQPGWAVQTSATDHSHYPHSFVVQLPLKHNAWTTSEKILPVSFQMLFRHGLQQLLQTYRFVASLFAPFQSSVPFILHRHSTCSAVAILLGMLLLLRCRYPCLSPSHC